MQYKKVRLKKWKDHPDKSVAEQNMEFDYIEWEGKIAIFQAPDTPGGITILDRRRKREE